MNARRNYLIDQAVEKVRAQTAQGGEIRCERAVAKAFLLRGDYFYNGAYKEPKAKHIGLGVYILTAKDKY